VVSLSLFSTKKFLFLLLSSFLVIWDVFLCSNKFSLEGLLIKFLKLDFLLFVDSVQFLFHLSTLTQKQRRATLAAETWQQEKHSGASRLPTLRLTTVTHSGRCLEVFHCSSAVSGWCAIATWSNRCHPKHSGGNLTTKTEF